METNQLRSLDLTSADFDLVIKALDQMPLLEKSGALLMEIFVDSMTAGLDGPKVDKMKRQRAFEQSKQDAAADLQKEEIRMLQGKLIRLKRLLIENDLMESIKYPPPR